jgi:hypothetical protein
MQGGDRYDEDDNHANQLAQAPAPVKKRVAHKKRSSRRSTAKK